MVKTIEDCLESDPDTSISSQDPTVREMYEDIKRLRDAKVPEDTIRGLLISRHYELNSDSPTGVISTDPQVVEGTAESFIEQGCHNNDFAV